MRPETSALLAVTLFQGWPRGVGAAPRAGSHLPRQRPGLPAPGAELSREAAHRGCSARAEGARPTQRPSSAPVCSKTHSGATTWFWRLKTGSPLEASPELLAASPAASTSLLQADGTERVCPLSCHQKMALKGRQPVWPQLRPGLHGGRGRRGPLWAEQRARRSGHGPGFLKTGSFSCSKEREKKALEYRGTHCCTADRCQPGVKMKNCLRLRVEWAGASWGPCGRVGAGGTSWPPPRPGGSPCLAASRPLKQRPMPAGPRAHPFCARPAARMRGFCLQNPDCCLAHSHHNAAGLPASVAVLTSSSTAPWGHLTPRGPSDSQPMSRASQPEHLAPRVCALPEATASPSSCPRYCRPSHLPCV